MSELGASSINLSRCPRFPAYSVGHSSFAGSTKPNWVWTTGSMGSINGISKGSSPTISSEVLPGYTNKGEQVYNPASGEPVINDDPKAEIKILHQQLAQAQEKQAALDSQISNLWELVQKQQGEFDSKILKFQTREKEQDQANMERQKVWEEERKREQAKWKQGKRHGKKGAKESSKKESGDGLKS